MYEVDDFTLYRSGRDLPQPGEVFQHGEGVAVVLDSSLA